MRLLAGSGLADSLLEDLEGVVRIVEKKNVLELEEREIELLVAVFGYAVGEGEYRPEVGIRQEAGGIGACAQEFAACGVGITVEAETRYLVHIASISSGVEA